MAAVAMSDSGLGLSGSGFVRLGKSRGMSIMITTGSFGTVTTRYTLRCYRSSDMTWQHWVSQTVDLSDAPGMPGDYAASTLTIESKVMT